MKKTKTFIITAVGSIVIYEAMRKSGLLDRLTGEIKKRVGHATNDPDLEFEGMIDKGKGTVKGWVHDLKETVES